MRNVIQGVLGLGGLLLVFGGVGYMELHEDSSLLLGTAESLIGLGLIWLAIKLEPAPQSTRIYRVGKYSIYNPYSRR